jgi:thermitase
VVIRSLSLALFALALLPQAAAADTAARIIVKRDRGLSAAEKRDVRADAGVRLVETPSLPRTEIVAAPRGEARQALRELNADPDVVYAEPDHIRHVLTADPLFSSQWGIENTGQDLFHDGEYVGTPGADAHVLGAWDLTDPDGRPLTGATQTVAVVDSGIYSDYDGIYGLHPDLINRVSETRSFVGAAETVDAPDLDGHGTGVSGTIAAEQGNNEGISGVAPDARIMALRVVDAAGDARDSDIAEALRYAGENEIRVVNVSLGMGQSSQTLRDAIRAYPETLFVVAAGNGGADESGDDNDLAPIYPCNTPEPNVVCVGASTNRDLRAPSSNFGNRSVDLFAPGEWILASVPPGVIDNLPPEDEYAFLEGTSLAAPHVAATAALVRQAAPGVTAHQLKQILIASVDHFAAFNRSVSGGRLNAERAVDWAVNGDVVLGTDTDGDGWVDAADACSTHAVMNSPDGCPLDDDWDGKINAVDNCVLDPNPTQQDGDSDGIGDACDPDWDNDGVANGGDNCAVAYNPTQADRDGDGLGDACDSDRDGDGRLNVSDSCPDFTAFTANGCPTPPPLDRDGDGRLDATDACPNEPAATNDGCPLPALAALSTRTRKRGTRRSLTVSVATSRPANVKVTVQRREGGRWVRITRATRYAANRATVTVARVRLGRYRVRVSIWNNAGTAQPATLRFRVR